MQMLKQLCCPLAVWTMACSTAVGAGSANVPVALQMPAVVEQFTADAMALNRTYSVAISPSRMERLEKFYTEKQAVLAAMNFDALAQEDKVDYLLLKNRLSADLHQLAIQKKQDEEMQPLLPFAKTIEDLMDRKRLMQRPDAEKDAAALSEMVKRIAAERF